MIRYFCDKCGVEISRENQFEHKEFSVGNNVVELTIMELPDTSTDANDAICLPCVLDEIYKLDNRLKAG